MSPSSTHSETDPPPRQKAVLFCPDCGHESPADGDWRRRRTAGTVTVVCPDCRSELTSRSATTPSADVPVGARDTGALVASTTDLMRSLWRTTRHQVAVLMRTV